MMVHIRWLAATKPTTDKYYPYPLGNTPYFSAVLCGSSLLLYGLHYSRSSSSTCTLSIEQFGLFLFPPEQTTHTNVGISRYRSSGSVRQSPTQPTAKSKEKEVP